MTVPTLRLGFDIGGTFTDFVLSDPAGRALRLHKRLTTPADPAIGALAGLRQILADAGAGFADVAEIVHGTTLVTNAIIEHRGARLGLITTAGFRDILEAGTEQRYDIYDLFLRYPEPLVPRHRRLEVAERIDRDGRVITPLNPADVREACRVLRKGGVAAVAICFLHAYREPRHELAAAAIVAEELPGIPVSVSSAVVAEIGEYARCVTTCANAYVQPLMASYLQRLEQALRESGFGGSLRLMHSAGGLLSVAAARAVPIRLLESGPAGGALAAALLGARAGHADLLAFDMGGTTAKACLIEGGQAQVAPLLEAGREHRFKKGSGLPIKAATVDMIEIGAGGGSIATHRRGRASAGGPALRGGAMPGPACYGRGGDQAHRDGCQPGARLLRSRRSSSVAPWRWTGRLHAPRLTRIAGPARPFGRAGRLGHPQGGGGKHGRRRPRLSGRARQGSSSLRHGRLRRGRPGPRGGGRPRAWAWPSWLSRPPPAPRPRSWVPCRSALGQPGSVATGAAGRGDCVHWAASRPMLQALEADARDELRLTADTPQIASAAVQRSAADMRLVGQMHEISRALAGHKPLDVGQPAGTSSGLSTKAYTARYAALQDGAHDRRSSRTSG